MNYNAYANSRNHFQGPAKKVLCVCSAGLLRSPTAAIVLQREFGYNTRSAGHTEEFALTPVTDLLCYWADEIVVMEDHMKYSIPEKHQDKVKVLGITDSYPYMDEELQKLIKEKYNVD